MTIFFKSKPINVEKSFDELIKHTYDKTSERTSRCAETYLKRRRKDQRVSIFSSFYFDTFNVEPTGKLLDYISQQLL